MFIFLIILAAVLIWAVFAYNRFVRLSTKAKEALSGIDVQLKRRYDLIPNLVSTVKGYATHEETVFQSVTNARVAAMGASSLAEKGNAEGALSTGLKSIFAIAEAYPDLKANQNFVQLQNDLTDTEDKIQASRRIYNSNVTNLNASIESFPSNLIAKSFNFSKMEFFGLSAEDSAAKDPVKVSF